MNTRSCLTVSLFLAAWCALLAPCQAQAEQTAGYRRDGTGIYPEAKPPVKFSYPADLRWEVLLPNWDHGSPIVIGDGAAGGGQGKVFAMVEPGAACPWPQLLCLDLKTGKELWRSVISTAEAAYPADPAKRAEAEQAWTRFREAVQQGYQQMIKDPASGGEKAPTAGKDKSLTAPLKAHGLSPETWHDGACGYRGVNCIGQAHATPVSDGTHVYVATAHGVFACFDLDGKRRWMRHVPGSQGEYCRNGRSPLLYKGLLISDITNKVRAFDAATGKLAWSDDGPAQAKTAPTASDVDSGDMGGGGSHTIVSPGVLTVGGTDVLWAAGCCAYRLPDGKRLRVEGWKDEGMQTLVKHDERDVVFFCGAGEHCGWTGKGRGVDPRPPAAVRFSLAGDTLKAKVLWSGISGQPWGGNRPWMLYHGGKLYAPGAGALDALTGKPVFGDFSGKGRGGGPAPESKHLLQIANGHVYGLSQEKSRSAGKGQGSGARMEVCTLDGKPVSACSIPYQAPTKDELELIRSSERQENWPEFSKGYTFTFGPDCVIIRGIARLYCFGQ